MGAGRGDAPAQGLIWVVPAARWEGGRFSRVSGWPGEGRPGGRGALGRCAPPRGHPRRRDGSGCAAPALRWQHASSPYRLTDVLGAMFDRLDWLGVALAGRAFVLRIEPPEAARPSRASIPDACALRLPPGGRLRHPPPRCAWRPPWGVGQGWCPDRRAAAPQLASSLVTRGGWSANPACRRTGAACQVSSLNFPGYHPCGPGFPAAHRTTCGVSQLSAYLNLEHVTVLQWSQRIAAPASTYSLSNIAVRLCRQSKFHK